MTGNQLVNFSQPVDSTTKMDRGGIVVLQKK